MSASQKNQKKISDKNENNATRHEQQIIDTSSIGVLITRIGDGTILYANKAIANLLGLADITTVIGMPVPDFYWDLEDRKAMLERFKIEGSITNNEIRARRIDGSMLWVSISIQPFQFEDEQVLLSEITDISARKQAEEALRQTQALYQSLVEVSPMSICRKDLAGRFTFANQRFLELSQITLADLVGKTDLDLHPSELADKYRRDDLAIMESGQVEEIAEERMMHEGETAYVETIKTPIYDETGKVSGIQVSFWDVTKRKQAEKAARESEELFRSIYDNATIGLYRTTPGGQILMINPTGLRLLGFDSFEEMSQRNLEQSGFEEVDARKKFRERLEREGVIEQESVWTKKDGSPIFVRESSTISRDENANILYYDGSFEDITAYKKAEDALRLSEERFRRFTEVTVEGLVFHEQGKIVDANPAALAMFGLSDNTEFFGRNLLEFIVPESQKQVLQQMQLEAVLPYEIQCVGKDGSPFPVETSTRTFKEGDRIIRASSIRDITDRKKAEQALQENQKFLTLVLDTMPGSLFWKDRNSIYLGSNLLFAKGGGLNDPSEIVGKSDYEMAWTKEEADAYIKDDRDVMESDKPKYHIIEPQLQANGKQTWVDTTKIPLHDAHGNVIGILGTFEDITERKQLEQQVQEAFEHRGYQVQVSTEISQEVAAASEINDLFDRVVTLTKERLGYYHTQLLRYDAAQDAVVLINGYGEIGQKMLAGGHQMPMGEGLIGTAAASGETVLRSTLTEDPDWQPNPLLPDTKGEIAVPIKWQNTVLGVLDVQSDQAGALSDEDRLLFEGLCGQIAIAMHSAELVEAVRQNEAKLSEALLTARLANWEYNVEKDLFTFNDQFYSIFHTTAEKAGGYQISSGQYTKLFVHPDDVGVVGSEIGKAMNSTERVYNTTLDHRIVYEDESIGYITVKVTVERNEAGKVTRFYGANQDITERKQAEEALRVNEARLAEALLTARLANWEYDVEKDIFTFNDHFYSIFHTTAEKAGGYQISSARYAELFVHPDDMEVVGTEIGKALSSTEKVYNTTIDHRIRYEDGGVGYIMVQLTVERDENGKITRYYGANQDITERKQAEETLRINEARLTEALKIARLANWEYDVEKDIFTFNDQFYSLFHTTAEQHGGYQLSSEYYAQHFVYPEDLPIVGVEIGQALNSTGRHYSRNMEHRVLYADGGIGHMQVNINVERDENGKITRYYGANQDITERIKQQQAMAERLEEINRLYQNLSHEGWKTYRDTADLPTGFIFDQTGTKVVDDEILADNLFANVPMKVLGGEVVGMLTVANDPRNPTSAEDLAFFHQVSDQIALALESARLTAQTQFALSQSERLFEASRRLAQVSDLQELVKTTVELFNIPVINGAELDMFSYDSGGELESLSVVANWWNGTGTKPGVIGSRFSKEMFSAVKLFLTPTPVFISDALDSERVDAPMLRIVKTLNIRAVTFLPLFVGTHQIGVLIMHAEETHNFTEEETRMFSGLAPLIATVLENRRQFERAQQQADRESTLNLISQKIQSATTVEAVLQIAARELGHALGAPMTIAQLSMKDKK